MAEIDTPVVSKPEDVQVGMWVRPPVADWPDELVEITEENLAKYQSDYVWFLGCPHEGEWCPEGFAFFISYEAAVKSFDED
jgi:hypothetical protein